MSEHNPERRDPSTGGVPPPQPPSYANTPNAERYVLEADAMRRRQLRSALLHGSSRTWREQRRVWPAVAVGIVVTSLVFAGTAIQDAVEKDRAQKAAAAERAAKEKAADERKSQEQQKQISPRPIITSPTATATPNRSSTSAPPSPDGPPL